MFSMPGRVAERFKAAVLKTARGFTLPRGFESHPFRQEGQGPFRTHGLRFIPETRVTLLAGPVIDRA